VVCVLVFVVIGRANHGHGEAVGGVASTAWPFLAGLAVGWLAALAWRHPVRLWPAGVGAWLGTVAVGMVLRVVAGQGTAVSFIIVALCFLGLFLLGWRLLARFFSRPAPRRTLDSSAGAAVHRGDRPAEGAGRGERLEHP
jgi:hypothetical protein